ncbi:putative phage transmembrane protein [Spiroplasma phoeniceum P40]|uniref:Phage transmembrane protein n=1 Tax=Spiroplasma phoeniceum P40 TaxID=1276259 RepID=A0A345DP75_9MOLU|nr:putative phage transmembrane protein [Spiroplasma phoeniceum P40]
MKMRLINLEYVSAGILIFFMVPICAYFIAGIIKIIKEKETSIILRQSKKIRKLKVELEKRKQKEVK